MIIHHSPHRGIYILYDPPMSVYTKVMSKGVMLLLNICLT